MIQKTWVVYFITALILFSCAVDQKITPDDPCYLEDYDTGDFPYIAIEYDSIMYYTPYFNPNNKNEFVYIENWQYASEEYLVYYNMQTGEKIRLADNADGFPKWAKTNWIVFNRGAQIWKIKSNGDSLTALFTTDENYEPVVSPDGNRIAFQNYDDYYNTIMADFNGVIIDSIPDKYFGKGAWSMDGLNISTRDPYSGDLYFSIGYYNTTLSNFTPLIKLNTTNPDQIITDTEWLPDSKRLLFLSNGKYQVIDIETKTISDFTEQCDKVHKLYPVFSPDGTKIIWEKVENELLPAGDGYHISSYIVITDANGENEQIIFSSKE